MTQNVTLIGLSVGLEEMFDNDRLYDHTLRMKNAIEASMMHQTVLMIGLSEKKILMSLLIDNLRPIDVDIDTIKQHILNSLAASDIAPLRAVIVDSTLDNPPTILKQQFFSTLLRLMVFESNVISTSSDDLGADPIMETIRDTCNTLGDAMNLLEINGIELTGRFINVSKFRPPPTSVTIGSELSSDNTIELSHLDENFDDSLIPMPHTHPMHYSQGHPVATEMISFFIKSVIPVYSRLIQHPIDQQSIDKLIRIAKIKQYVTQYCLEESVDMTELFPTNGETEWRRIDTIYNTIIDNSNEYKSTIMEDNLITHLDRMMIESDMAYICPDGYREMKESISAKYFDLAMIACNEKPKPTGRYEYYLTLMVYESMCSCTVTSGKTMDVIWMFTNNLWKQQRSTPTISNYLMLKFIRYISDTYKGRRGLVRTINHLINSHVVTKMMTVLKSLLYFGDFESKLDSCRNIICLENGICDMRSASSNVIRSIQQTIDSQYIDHVTVQRNMIRCALPSDLCSMNTKIPLIKFDETSSEYIELMSILQKIFPDPEVLNYFIASCSSFLDGYNHHKHVYVWWGRGNNAKSVTQQLIMHAFGSYCSTCPVSLVTGSRQSSHGATPEFAKIEGRLVVFLQEPNPGERIRAGQLKELSGNDTMYARNIFGMPRNIEIKAKFVIVANNIMDIPGLDLALRRRIVVIPFESTFEETKDDEPETNASKKNVFPIDHTIEQRLKELAHVFMSMIIHKRKDLNPSKLPKKIREKTKEYIDKNNHSIQFIRENVIRRTESWTSTDSIYSDFKSWFAMRYPARQLPTFDDFCIQLHNFGFVEEEGGLIKECYLKPFYANLHMDSYLITDQSNIKNE